MNLKWHSLNIGFRRAINTGVGLILWAIGFFILTHMAAHHANVAQLYPVALTGWTGGFVSFLLKRNSNNKIRLAATKDNLTLETEQGEQGEKR